MSAVPTNGKNHASRKFSLLAAGGLLVITVIRIPSLVDLWTQMDSQQSDRQQMLSSMSDGSPGRAVAEQLTEVEQELSEIKSRMVGSEQMPAIQSQLMELARNSGCQLRKAVVQAGSSETWEIERQDDPELEIVDPSAPTATPILASLAQEPEYSLSTEQIGLTFTGTLKQSFDFLDQARQSPWLMKIAQIKLTRLIDSDGQLVVEANLAFHRLERKEKNGMESGAWREGSRQ